MQKARGFPRFAPDMSRDKPWGGRFQASTDSAVERFTASIDFDRALARYDIRGSIAHARMLGQHRRDPAGRCRRDRRGPRSAFGLELDAGTLQLDPRLEDIHMNIETRLRERIGPVAGRLHTGRSRNDQVATDLALYLRDAARAVRHGLLELRRALVDARAASTSRRCCRATRTSSAPSPCGSRITGSPTSRCSAATPSASRTCAAGIARCPLGSGAIAGSTLPLDRAATARALGFEGPTRNSMDAVGARDVALEFLAAAAIAMVHLSRLAEELVLWSTTEFGFIELSDAFTTGSSLMPQKKNPDVPELVRGKAGRVIGDLVALLTVVKGLPLTYNRDLQEDKEPLFDAAVDAARLARGDGWRDRDA